MNDIPKRPVGRPPAIQDKVRVSYTIDDDLPASMEAEALREGFTHKRSGKPNVSLWLNELLRKRIEGE